MRSTDSAWVRMRPAQTVATSRGRCWTWRCRPWVTYTVPASGLGGARVLALPRPHDQRRTALGGVSR
jgi:hypothetical protein